MTSEVARGLPVGAQGPWLPGPDAIGWAGGESAADRAGAARAGRRDDLRHRGLPAARVRASGGAVPDGHHRRHGRLPGGAPALAGRPGLHDGADRPGRRHRSVQPQCHPRGGHRGPPTRASGETPHGQGHRRHERARDHLRLRPGRPRGRGVPGRERLPGRGRRQRGRSSPAARPRSHLPPVRRRHRRRRAAGRRHRPSPRADRRPRHRHRHRLRHPVGAGDPAGPGDHLPGPHHRGQGEDAAGRRQPGHQPAAHRWPADGRLRSPAGRRGVPRRRDARRGPRLPHPAGPRRRRLEPGRSLPGRAPASRSRPAPCCSPSGAAPASRSSLIRRPTR